MTDLKEKSIVILKPSEIEQNKSSPSRYKDTKTNNNYTNNNNIIQNLEINLSSSSNHNNHPIGLDQDNIFVDIDDSVGKKSINNNIPNQPDPNHPRISHFHEQSTGKQNNTMIKSRDDVRNYSNRVNNDNNISNIKPPSVKNPNQNLFTFAKSLDFSNDTLMFFFVNKYSGEGKGIQLLNMSIRKIEFTYDIKVTTFIYDINYDLPGIEMLKSELTRVSKIKVIIGGGDGSIVPFLERLAMNDVELDRLIFGILPLGRTNDLSRQCGFDTFANGICSDMTVFKTMVKGLNNTTSTSIDVWEIKLTCDEKEGGIITCSSQVKSHQKDHNNKKITVLRKGFICHCSLGYDARIGFGAGKRRSGNKCCNDTILLWEKCKKYFCQKSIHVKGFIDSFFVVDTASPYKETNSNDSHNDSEIDVTHQEDTKQKTRIFISPNEDGKIPIVPKGHITHVTTNPDVKDKSTHDPLAAFKYKEVILKGDPVGFVCQNIKYFRNDQSNWEQASPEYGIETYEPDILKDDKEAIEKKNENDIKMFNKAFGTSGQNFNDKKLEFYSYSSMTNMTSAQKDKIYHGEGPFIIKFKPTPSYTQEDKFNRIYLNIDGEYYNLIKPIEMRIRLAKRVNNGTVKFLQNV